MRAGASVSRSEPEPSTEADRPFGFPRALRLRTARDFEALRFPTFRVSLQWIALAARIAEGGHGDRPPLRFGVAVSKRVARKSFQRNLVKRILRESIRQSMPLLARAAATRRVDVVLRMKAAFPAAERMALAPLRRALRGEADQLLRRLANHLAAAGQP